MSFYNPYMKGPDFGAGFQDIMSQIAMMLMMSKLAGPGKGKTTEETGIAPLPGDTNIMGMPGVGGSGESTLPPSTPQIPRPYTPTPMAGGQGMAGIQQLLPFLMRMLQGQHGQYLG